MPKKQTLLSILLLAVFTMVVSGCGKQPENNQVNNNNQQQEKREKALNRLKKKMSNLGISDWEIFENEKIGYLMAYPSKKWQCGGSSCTNIENRSWGATVPNIKISLLENTDIVDPVKYVKNSYHPSFFVTPIPSKTNYENYDRKGVKLTHIEGNESFGKNKVVYIFLKVNGNLIKIEAHLDEDEEEKAVIEKMLQSAILFSGNSSHTNQSKNDQMQAGNKNIQSKQAKLGWNKIKNKMTEVGVPDWKIFKNEEIGYFIAYPADTWKCGHREKGDPYVCSNIKDKTGNDMIYNIRINAIDDTDIVDPIEYVNKTYNDSFFTTPTPNESNYEISGKKAVKLTHILGNKVSKKSEVIYVFVEHDGRIFKIVGRVDKKNREREVIKKMLQTIVFFNEDKEDSNKEETSTEIKYLDNGEIDISDWKTYRNEVYGLKIKYPPEWFVEKKNNYIYIKSKLRKDKLAKGLPVRLFDIKIREFDSLDSLKDQYHDDNQLNFEDWLKKRSFVKQEVIAIDKLPARKGYFKNALERSTFIYIKTKDDKYLEIEFNVLDNKTDKIINKIISEIKL